jgi:hypothetical protein
MLGQTSQKAKLFAHALRTGILGLFAVFVCALLLSLLAPGRTNAATSSTINFQARLENSGGSIAPDGNYNVEFKLFNASSSSGSSQGSCSGDANCEWVEDYTYNSGSGSSDVRVRVANGYLTVNLGSITAFPGINWNQQQWLTMNIGGTVGSGTITWDGEMSPRLLLSATPYAFQAGAVSSTDGSGNIGSLSFGSVTNNPSITLPNASGTVCLQSTSACGFATGSGTAFLQGGNSFSAVGELGTNDSNALNFRTNNTDKLQLTTGGNLVFQQASTVNIASATTGMQLTIQGGAATSGTNVGGNILLQGGAGASTGASGSVIVKSNTNNSTTAFQVQNANGTALFSTDTTAPASNLLTNPGFEVNTTGWQATGTGASIARNTTAADTYYGVASLAVTLGSGSGTGAQITPTGYSGGSLSTGTYTFSFYAAGSAALSGVAVSGFNGGSCTLNRTSVLSVSAFGFEQYYCTVTTTGATTGNISITVTTGSQTLYIDGAQLVSGSTLPPFSYGNLQVRGTVTTPLTLENTANSSSAFQILNASGTSIVDVNTTDGTIGLGTAAAQTRLTVVGVGSVATVTTTDLLTASGTFSSGSGWTTGTGWSIGSGVATATAATGNLSGTTTVTNGSSSGAVFQVSFDVPSYTSGSFDITLGTADAGAAINAAGTGQVVYLTSSAANAALNFVPTTFTGTIDNVTVKLVTNSTQDLVVKSSDGNSSPLDVRAGGSGAENTFVGSQSGWNTIPVAGIQGTDNSFFGDQTGWNNVTGAHNTFLGDHAGLSNTSGSYNDFTGDAAGYNNISGSFNVFDGWESGYTNSTANYNSFYGYQSGFSNTTGSQNVFIGKAAGYSNTTGQLNAYLGYAAGYNNLTGVDITAVGYQAGLHNTADKGTFIGFEAGRENTSGASNTAIGYHAIFQNTTGLQNTVLGFAALDNLTAANNNTALGYEAGFSDVTGGGNVFLGSMAGYNELAANKLYIGNATAGNGTSSLLYGNFATSGTNGKLGVNVDTTSSAPALNATLDVRGTGIYTTGSTTALQVQDGSSVTKFDVDTSNGRIGIGTAAPTADLSFGVADRTINILDQTASNTAGNILTLNSGKGNGSGAGGQLTVKAGIGGATGNGGAVVVQGGTGGATSGTGGAATLQGGTAIGAFAGGTASLTGGTADATAGSNGGAVAVTGGAGTSTGTGGVGGAITITAGNAGGSGDNAGGSITLQAGSATGIGTIGQVLVKNAANSTSSFQVQDSSGNSVLTVDTSGSQVVLGKTSTSNGTIVFDDSSNANTVTVASGNTSGTYSLTLPTSAPSTNQCLLAGPTTASLLTFGTCSGAGNTTLQQAYNASAGASPGIDMTSTNKGFTLQNDNGSPITGELFGVHAQTAAGLGASLFTVSNNGVTLVKSRAANNSTSAFQVQDASANVAFDVDTTNLRVGMGTGSPQATFHLVSGTSTDSMYVDQYGSTAPAYIGRSANGTVGSPTATATDDRLVVLGGRGYFTSGGTGFASLSNGTVQIQAAQNFTSANQGTYIAFLTASLNTTSKVDRLHIDPDGNLQFRQASTININSATTGTQLKIQGGAATSGTNVGGNLLLQGGAGASTGASGSVIVESNTNNSTTAFQVQNGSASSILDVDTTNGRVGIGSGNTAPGRTLDVSGSIGGSTRTDAQTNCTTTQTESTAALAYYFSNTVTANDTCTFDITGVPNTEGGLIFISAEAIGDGSHTSNVIVKINSGATPILASFGTSSATPSTKNITVVYVNAKWRTMGSVGTADTNDLAEWIKTTGRLPKNGELLSAGDNTTAHPSSGKYDKAVMGIVSTNPNTTYGQQTNISVPMALTGRVPAIVTSLNGPIAPGDPVVASDLAGVGMLPTVPSQTVGKALQTFDPSSSVCVDASSYNSIIWPEDDGSNQNKPCFRVPVSSFDNATQQALAAGYGLAGADFAYVGKIMVQSGTGFADSTDVAVLGASSISTTVLQTQVNDLASQLNQLSQSAKLSQPNTFTGTNENQLQIQDAQGNVLFNADTAHMTITVQNIVVAGTITVNGHVITAGNAPTSETLAAAGVDAQNNNDSVCSINGNDTNGTITLAAGSSNTKSGAQCIITFDIPFSAAPRPVLSANDQGSVGLGAYVQAKPDTMTLYFSNVPQANHTYTLNYWNSQ